MHTLLVSFSIQKSSSISSINYFLPPLRVLLSYWCFVNCRFVAFSLLVYLGHFSSNLFVLSACRYYIFAMSTCHLFPEVCVCHPSIHIYVSFCSMTRFVSYWIHKDDIARVGVPRFEMMARISKPLLSIYRAPTWTSFPAIVRSRRQLGAIATDDGISVLLYTTCAFSLSMIFF